MIPDGERIRGNAIMGYGIIKADYCTIYNNYGKADGTNRSGIADDLFSGWAVMFDEDSLKDGWVLVTTHYGYSGYVRRDNIACITVEELKQRQYSAGLHRIVRPTADVLDIPRVQGSPTAYLLKNSFVNLLAHCDDGWSLIETAKGCRGYVRTVFLEERADDDGFLLGTPLDRQKGLGYLRDETGFRKKTVESAKAYLKTQYRWGGKSSQGLDCSGLAFVSYFENGLLIYRDAKIMPGFPVHRIEREELKEGDLIYFPGHMAIYLGNQRYIHSTAHKESAGVTINSFNPHDRCYRADLSEKITGYGSVFV